MTRIFIPTTQYPVEIISLTEEHSDIQSVICITNTFNALPVSAAYHAFIRRPTGIIERITGIPSFRADVSGPIDQGDSWQLAMLIAHRLHHKNGFSQNDNYDLPFIWASGQVDINQTVSPIHHIREKLLASKPLFEEINSRGGQLHIALHPDNMADATDIIPNYAICHPLAQEADINQLLSSMLLQHHQNESQNQIDHMESAEQSSDTPKRRQSNSIFSLINILSPFCNKGWKRLIAGYGLVAILLFTLQQMIPWHPIHAAMEMEKSGEHVKLIRMLKSYRQDDNTIARLSFLYFEEAYLQQKSDQLIAQIDMQLVWAVANDNASSCENDQMRWHRYTITDANLPSLPQQRCHLYLEIQNRGDNRLALAVAINVNDSGQIIPLLQPAQTQLAPTEHIRHPIHLAEQKPFMILVSSSDHMTTSWYRWFKRWANRPAALTAKKSLKDTGIGVHMAAQDKT